MNISKLKGIGDQTAAKFARLGIEDTNDLLLFCPRGYEEYQPSVTLDSIGADGVYAVWAVVSEAPKLNTRSASKLLSVTLTDSKGNSFHARWFHSTYLVNQLKKGYRYIFRGVLHPKGQQMVMEQPKLYSYEEYENLIKSTPLLPIYRLTAGLTSNAIHKAITQCFEKDLVMEDFLPLKLCERLGLPDYYHALWSIHHPRSLKEANQARQRLAFNEFFLFTLGIRIGQDAIRLPNMFQATQSKASKQVLSSLGFSLTNAQRKAYEDILSDYAGNTVANRLIQGDVGSGKTILAFLAMLDIVATGAQALLMAPTEVLATQHYEALCRILTKNHLPYQVALLTGSVKESQKKRIREGLASGEISMAIGTHALITDKVTYANVGLVITDEQHRFGVRQRDALYDKGIHPHVLVMSATPIPRSLAVILYGDLDISIIDEKPSNRLPIKNCVVNSGYHPNAYRFITNEVHKGHQAYVICAMAKENEESELENVVEYAKTLQDKLPSDIRISYLHGQMKPAEKAAIMEAFSRHEMDVLVSTTVIEVGIDVPNATVIMVENAERFGLSALHQLRGRVGRGDAQSYCIFVSDSQSETTQTRLGILKDSNDGFYIAEQDLKLRGPGDLLGVRQSGELGFRIGDIYADAQILKLAANEANHILKEDADLSQPSHQLLKKELAQYAKNHLLHLSI